MNIVSLQQSFVLNQHKPSWNDDPFDLKGSFDGVSNLNHQKNNLCFFLFHKNLKEKH